MREGPGLVRVQCTLQNGYPEPHTTWQLAIWHLDTHHIFSLARKFVSSHNTDTLQFALGSCFTENVCVYYQWKTNAIKGKPLDNSHLQVEGIECGSGVVRGEGCKWWVWRWLWWCRMHGGGKWWLNCTLGRTSRGVPAPGKDLSRGLGTLGRTF